MVQEITALQAQVLVLVQVRRVRVLVQLEPHRVAVLPRVVELVQANRF